MTATTSKLGADMLKDLEEIRSTLKNASCMSDYGDTVEMLSDLIDALARQPAAIGLLLGVSVDDKVATIVIQQPHSDGSVTVIYSGTHPNGDSVSRVKLAPLANEASKPAAQQTLSDGAQFFACYLIDNCENEVVREESVQAWLGKMLASPRYHPAAPSVEQDERGALPLSDFREGQWWISELDAWAETGSDDQKRAVAVVHRLLRAVRAASTSANVARLSIDDLQGKALEHGFKYWRASDAHGITGTAEQAENLIADLIGVEVEVTSQISPFADVAQGARPVPRDFFVPGQMARPFKAPDAGEHDPWYVALPNGNLIKLGFHADDSVDRAQAEFIADAINAALTASPAFALRALYTYADSANVAQGAENTDDIAIDSFARAMKEKMAAARAKGRSGWEGCEPADLSRMLREHVEKGDPRDVANFCMMLWHHSAPIASPAQTALTDDVLMQAIADTAARGHVWASRALSNFRAAVREAAKSPDDA
jgi:hypothetical protein